MIIMKKNYLVLICLIILIAFSLISCKGEDAKVVYQVPHGFVSLNELNNRADSILRCTIWETQISFELIDPNVICIYQTNIDNSDVIVKYKKKYYINEEKYLELTEVAALALEQRNRTYNLGDTVEILGAEKNYKITIKELVNSDSDGTFDIKFATSNDVAENELRSIFSFVEIKVINTNSFGTDNMFDFIDAETVRIKMRADRKIDTIVLKSPDYPGLNYRIVVDE